MSVCQQSPRMTAQSFSPISGKVIRRPSNWCSSRHLVEYFQLFFEQWWCRLIHVKQVLIGSSLVSATTSIRVNIYMLSCWPMSIFPLCVAASSHIYWWAFVYICVQCCKSMVQLAFKGCLKKYDEGTSGCYTREHSPPLQRPLSDITHGQWCSYVYIYDVLTRMHACIHTTAGSWLPVCHVYFAWLAWCTSLFTVRSLIVMTYIYILYALCPGIRCTITFSGSLPRLPPCSWR